MKLNIPFHDEVCEFTEIKKQPATSSEMLITKQFGTIVKRFKILYCGWEMDSCGYIVNGGAVNKIVVTNHGQPMVVDSGYLNAKIKEYEDAIEDTKEAIKISQNGRY